MSYSIRPNLNISYSMCPNNIIDAVLANDLDYILDNYPDFNPNCYVQDRDRHGHQKYMPLLHLAIKHHRLDSVEWLIHNGANLDERNPYGETALHVASDHCNLRMAMLLIDHGANVSAKDNKNDTPLMGAVNCNNYDLVKLLLNQGADPNNINDYGETVLHHASRNGYFDIVKLLLDYGVDNTYY